MIKNYLKIILRSLWKNRTFVFINIVGMGIALACCIVAYLNYEYNQKFDVEHVNAEKIYRVNFIREFQGRSRKYGYVPRPLGANIRENISDVDKVVRVIPSGANLRIKDELFVENMSYVDPDFFNIFSFEIVAGSTDGLANPSNIYISDELARNYFDEEDPIGKPITHVLDSSLKEYVVAGVFKKKPSNSSFMFLETVSAYENFFTINPAADQEDWRNFGVAFVEISNPRRLSVITDQLQDYVAPQNNSRDDFKVTRYYLDPFVGMAVRTETENVANWGVREGLPTAAVIAPLIMAGMVLLLACFNFTNTSIAMSGRRLKEIGLRKVMGGRRKQLIAQFLSENLLLCLLALGVGLLIAEFLVPAYSQMWDFIDLELSYTQNFNIILFLVGLLFLTGIIAGGYPAFYISKFEATSILKGTTKFGGTNLFTKILLAGQFLISLIGIIFGVAFVQNANYQKSLDLGYEGDNVLHVSLSGKSEFNVYKNILEGNPDIMNIAGSEHQLMEFHRNDPIRFEEIEREVDMYTVGDNFLETMEIDLIEGRKFIKDSETDRAESIIVTEILAEEFGWDDPLGKRLIWRDTVQLFVVGVIKNLYTNALWAPLEPSLLRYGPEDNFNFLTVRAREGSAQEVDEYMKEKWAEVFPNSTYTGEYLNIDMQEALEVNNNIVKLFIFLGVVATILSAVGLFSLVSLNIIKRMKEIGVRKVLGASVGNIAKNLNKQYVIILGIASILGAAASFFLVGLLMGTIWTYHMEMNVVVIALSVLTLFVISGITISFKIYGAATANPAYTLRDE